MRHITTPRASPAQREAILRIMSGQDTEPGATFFQVYGSMFEKVHDPIFAKIDLDIDVNARKARFIVPEVVEARGEPIINPVTKKEHRARFNMPDGFEFTLAEVGRGWAKTHGASKLNLADSHAHFAELNIEPESFADGHDRGNAGEHIPARPHHCGGCARRANGARMDLCAVACCRHGHGRGRQNVYEASPPHASPGPLATAALAQWNERSARSSP